ncbi:EAL domain-containing protein [Shewanella avicenniae]|uniref:EAL domain-containing protein n=1 Tax=Shewanella avicenniae TaxID=2814294 RepID=A0ABX7QU34_9GAMM|nr:EAL domain-containing protein [Shewanella avicenniae]QSX34148.1 EAL domain-containing protein [Shewanella avicenniae]
MYESTPLELEPFERRKNRIQHRVNQMLFGNDFDYDTVFEQLTARFAPLALDDVHVRFFKILELEQTQDAELAAVFAFAKTKAYDGQFWPLCPEIELTHAYFALYELEELCGLLRISGNDILQRLSSQSLGIYFNCTSAKLSYRLSDFLRMSRLNLANKVISHAREAIVITDPSGVIIRVNESFTRITGYSAEEAIGQTPRVLKSGVQSDSFYQELWQQLLDKGYWFGEFVNKTKSGKIYNQRGSISAIHNDEGELKYFAAMMEDVTELKRSEATLNRLSYFDALTGLPNRVKLKRDYSEYLATESGTPAEVAVLVIDLDDFKHVNDAMGHGFGDELLKAVAERIRDVVDTTGTVYRFGGDEFVVLTKYHPNRTLELVENLIERMKAQYEVRFSPILISCCIGIAISGRDGDTLDQLMSRADLAMYSAKEGGHSRFAFCSDELHQSAFNNLYIRGELKSALASEQMRLVYQPKRCIAAESVVGCEALVRWQHPLEGDISPVQFIPIAERSGMIVEIDYWVLHAAIKQLACWRNNGLQVVPVAINVSLPTFAHDGFVEDLQSLLQRYDVPGEMIELEITERVALRQVRSASAVMHNIIALGIKISMDDFGTGYSSLSYLNQLPISTLKIDRAFVSDIEQDPLKQGITGAIVAMAKAMKLKTVAEGVETEAEFNYLAQLGCDQLQGYYYAKPLSAQAFVEWLAEDTLAV